MTRFFKDTEGFALEGCVAVRDYPDIGITDRHESHYVLSLEASAIHRGSLQRSRLWYVGFSESLNLYDLSYSKASAYEGLDENWFDLIIHLIVTNDFPVDLNLALHPETIKITRVDTYTRILETDIPLTKGQIACRPV